MFAGPPSSKTPRWRNRKPDFPDRFFSLVLGALFGLFTFVFWLLVLLIRGGPGAGKAGAAIFLTAFKWAGYMAAVMGLLGFLLGSEKLATLFGILWGTDPRVRNFEITLPDWLIVSLVVVALVVGWGMVWYVL